MLQYGLSANNSKRALSGVVASAAAISAALYSTSQCETEDGDDNFRIEVHLMDKISQKSYLQSAKDGIPSTLRILAIDLPDMRTNAFNGVCRLSHDKIFVDDIAPPKVIAVNSETSEKESKEKVKGNKELKLKVSQKALVKVRSEDPQVQIPEFAFHSLFFSL